MFRRTQARFRASCSSRCGKGPCLLVLIIACMSVGTLVHARTATREGEITVRLRWARVERA